MSTATGKKTSRTRRAQGEGTIFFNEQKNRWIVKIILGTKKDGRTVYRTAHCRTQSEAVERKKELLAKYSNIAQIDAEKMTVSSYLDQYLKIYKKNNVRENTYLSYRNAAGPVKELLGRIRLASLTLLHVKAMMGDLIDKPGAASHGLTVLRMACRQAVEDGMLRSDPTAHIKKPRTGKNLTVITPAEFEVLVRFAADENRIALLIAYTTGMRPEEVLGLYWSNLNFKKAAITVDHAVVRGEGGRAILGPPKNDSSYRTLNVPQKLIADLRQWQKEQAQRILRTPGYENNSLIVARPDGKPMTSNTFAQRFYSIAQKAGIAITMKGLRHTHATQLFTAGWHPKDVQERLGHSSIATTMDIYTAYIPARSENIAEYFNTIYPKST